MFSNDRDNLVENICGSKDTLIGTRMKERLEVGLSLSSFSIYHSTSAIKPIFNKHEYKFLGSYCRFYTE